MSKIKSYEKLIPKIHRRSYGDISMYFFVAAQRSILPAITIEKAMYNYFRFIREEDFNIESSLVTFTRLQKEFNEL
jgi:hypothetical protein